MKQKFPFVVALVVALQASAQSVIFPQEQQAGAATSAVVDDTYTLANDLLSASFVLADGKLTFGGCEAMGLKPSDDLFGIRLGTGTEAMSSAMTLKGVEAEDLAADASAVRGSLKLPARASRRPTPTATSG